MKIFCFMNAGKPLTEKLADVLFVNAHDMIENNKKEQIIKGRGFEGFITTDMESVTFVGTAGIVFEADIYAKSGSQNKVKFFVKDKDLDGLEKAEWLGCIKEEDEPKVKNKYKWN